MKSDPNEDDSTDVCFLLHQWTRAEFRNTTKPVCDRLVIVSAAWSASTLALIVNPTPRGSGMLGGSSSRPSMCPNSLAVQSRHWNWSMSTTGLLGSYTNLLLWYFFRYANVWNTCCICPSLGGARCDDSMEISKQISTLPSSTIQLNTRSVTGSTRHPLHQVLETRPAPGGM